MKKFESVIGLGLAVVTAGSVISGCTKAAAQQRPTSDREIELTVYKDDFAMVSETRPVNLESGHSQLAIKDISKQLDPESVLFDWSNGNHHPEVVATKYDLGVGNGSSLLSRLNGQLVDMMWPSNDGKPGETISGRLEAAQQGENFALRTSDKLYVNPGGTIVASAETAASTLPQLSVELESRESTKTRLGLSYLTRGMSWSADYVAKLKPNSDVAEIDCWATVKNTTGIPFPAAHLTLMAGSPNRTAAMMDGPGASTGLATNGYTGEGNVATNTRNAVRMSVGETYAYQIPSTATIGQDQMNRVSVLGTRLVPIKRDYAIRIPSLGGSGFQQDGIHPQSHEPAVLSIRFVNDAASHLGVPLPSGSVRVYEKDSGGQERYTGAASIADTPKKEHVSLALSDVFDVYAGYRVIDSQRISKHLFRKTVQAVLHNEKNKPIEVRVVQGFDDHWTPVSESSKSEQLDSSTIQWKVTLKAGEDKPLKYVVDVRE